MITIFIVGLALFLGAILTGLGIIFYLAISSPHEWAVVEKDLLGRGEKLRFADLASPRIPKEQDFFADPLWDSLPAHDSSFPKLSAEEVATIQKRFPDEPLRGGMSRESVAERVWNRLPPEASQEAWATAAELTSMLLASQEVELSQIRELAQRPLSRYPLPHEEGRVWSIEWGPAMHLLQAARLLRARAMAALARGDGNAAFSDAHLIFQLDTALRNAPTTGLYTVRLNLLRTGLGLIQAGLEKNLWSDSQLTSLSAQLSEIDVLKVWPDRLREDRAGMNETFLFVKGQVATWHPFKVLMIRDQTAYNRLVQLGIDELNDSLAKGFFRTNHTADAVQERLDHSWDGRMLFFTRISQSDLIFGWREPVYIQALIGQARVAIALELYRRVHHTRPAKLASLVPAYLAEVPLDPVDRQPLRYHPLDHDQYRLWSIGSDRTDDDGLEEPGHKGPDWCWPPPSNSGSPKAAE